MIQTGIVGLGKVGQTHINNLRQHPDAVVVAVCDKDSNQLDEFNEEISSYTKLNKMLSQGNLDSVHVCTPPQTHLDIAKEVLQAEIPVLLEKPAVMNLDEMEELRAVADDHDPSVSVVHNQKFSPYIQQARKYVNEGKIGDVVAVTLIHTEKFDLDDPHRNEWVFDLPGGEIAEGIPHQIYLSLAFVDGLGEVKSVDKHHNVDYENVDFDGLTIEATDISGRRSLTIKIMTNATEHKSLIHIHGTDGEILVDSLKYGVYLNTTQQRFSPKTLLSDTNDLGSQIYSNALKIAKDRVLFKLMKLFGYSGTKRHELVLQLPHRDHYIQFDNHINALQSGKEPPVSLDEVYDTMQVFDALYDN